MEASKLSIVREEPEPCRVRLTVEIPAVEVAAGLEKATDQYRKRCQIPGFRQGKSPRALVERRFAKEIQEEAKYELIQQAVTAAVQKQDVEPETRPRLENEEQIRLQPGQSLAFAVTFDVLPAFELPDYRTVKIEAGTAAVGDDDVQRAISDLLQGRASYAKVERQAQAGDLLRVSYQGSLADAGTGTPVPDAAKMLLTAENTWLALRDPEILPGSIAALVGCQADTERTVQVHFPAGYFEPSLAGRTADYRIRILEVHGAQVPELTDDLAKQLGAEDVEGMRTNVRRQLEAEEQRRQHDAVRNQVLRQLMENVEFAVPPTVLASETYTVFFRLLQDEARRTRDDEQLKEKQRELLDQARTVARERLKRHYVLRRIADQEKLTVDQEEIDVFLGLMALYQRISVRALRRRLEQSGRIGDVVTEVLERKTLDRIVALATGGTAAAPAALAAPAEPPAASKE